jgi:hypothetical protein
MSQRIVTPNRKRLLNTLDVAPKSVDARVNQSRYKGALRARKHWDDLFIWSVWLTTSDFDHNPVASRDVPRIDELHNRQKSGLGR